MPPFDQWGEELAAALAEPFAPETHKTKRQGGSDITFVEWHRYVDRLNATVGPGGWEVRLRFVEVGGKLITVSSLTILGVTKENVGDEDEDKDNYGTACTNSFAQSYKRAAALFGLGLYLYDEAKRNAATGGRAPAPRPSTNGGGADKASDKQVGLINGLMRDALLTDAERAGVQTRIDRGMTKRQASEAIEWLQTTKAERNATANATNGEALWTS